MGEMADMAVDRGLQEECEGAYGSGDDYDGYEYPVVHHITTPRQHRRVRRAQMARSCYWEYIEADDWTNAELREIVGKYLFFSKDRQLLLDIARAEIDESGFRIAKVSTSANGGDFVLCLYWTDDERKWELAEKYGKSKTVKYRYWKSDEDTRNGVYSEQFKKG